MTDTTDIAALRKKFGNTLPKPEHAREKLTDMLNGPHAASWFLTPYVISVLDALEAERQRVGYGQQVIDQRNAECDHLINEIAALKAKLANPVVLPDSIPRALYQVLYEECGAFVECDLNPSTVWQAFKTLHAAGFTVKGE